MRRESSALKEDKTGSTGSTQDPEAYDWIGAGWTFTNASYTTNGARTLAAGSLPALGGPNHVAVTKLAVDVYTRDDSRNAPPYKRLGSGFAVLRRRIFRGKR